VGIWLTSTTPNIFSRNYSIKASKARNSSNAAFAMKHRIGSLPNKEGLTLYMARVDCYLTSGADICLDVDARLLDEHLDAQHSFLRRRLGINSRSMLAILFTETGLMPIRIRRLLLALGRLHYMVSLGAVISGCSQRCGSISGALPEISSLRAPRDVVQSLRALQRRASISQRSQR
jgi:hypothetical protein